MISYKTYFTEVTKKDILAGFDANARYHEQAKEYTNKIIKLANEYKDKLSTYKSDHLSFNKAYDAFAKEITIILDGLFDDRFGLFSDKFGFSLKDLPKKHPSGLSDPTFREIVFARHDTQTYVVSEFAQIVHDQPLNISIEKLNLVFYWILKNGKFDDAFFKELTRINRKYGIAIGHDPDELQEPDDD